MRSLLLRESDGLGHDDPLVGAEPQSLRQHRAVHEAANDRRESRRRAPEVDVLADEARVDRGVEVAVRARSAETRVGGESSFASAARGAGEARRLWPGRPMR